LEVDEEKRIALMALNAQKKHSLVVKKGERAASVRRSWSKGKKVTLEKTEAAPTIGKY